MVIQSLSTRLIKPNLYYLGNNLQWESLMYPVNNITEPHYLNKLSKILYIGRTGKSNKKAANRLASTQYYLIYKWRTLITLKNKYDRNLKIFISLWRGKRNDGKKKNNNYCQEPICKSFLRKTSLILELVVAQSCSSASDPSHSALRWRPKSSDLALFLRWPSERSDSSVERFIMDTFRTAYMGTDDKTLHRTITN